VMPSRGCRSRRTQNGIHRTNKAMPRPPFTSECSTTPKASSSAACSACNGKGYFRIGPGEAWCRKCHLKQYEARRPIPLMEPTLLFDEETAKSIDWRAYYPFYPSPPNV
jgi:hypothetical protein